MILWGEMPELQKPWMKDEAQLDRLIESAMRRKKEKRVTDLEHYVNQLKTEINAQLGK